MNHLLSVKRVGVAVLPMDGLTGGRAVNGTVHIFMEDGGACIRKPDGYVVFWDNGNKERTLVLESPYYGREAISLNMEVLRRKKTPSLQVWLKPGPAYPYPFVMQLAHSKTEPAATVSIPLELSAGAVQLQTGYPMDNPSRIHLRITEGIEAEGRTLLMRRLSDGREELFTIGDVRDSSIGIYELEAPLQEEYSIYDTQILLVLQVVSDAHGRYWIPKFEENERGME